MRSKSLPGNFGPPHPSPMHSNWVVKVLCILQLLNVYSTRQGCPGRMPGPGRCSVQEMLLPQAAWHGLDSQHSCLRSLFILWLNFRVILDPLGSCKPCIHDLTQPAQSAPNYIGKFIQPNILVTHLLIIQGWVRIIVLIVLFFLLALKEARDKLFENSVETLD